MLTQEQIREEFPDHAFYFEYGFDEAIMGISRHWHGNRRVESVAYDYNKCVEILMERDKMDWEGAPEVMDSLMSAYVGEHTPVYIMKGLCDE